MDEPLKDTPALPPEFDTTEDEASLEALRAELEQSQEAIDKGFALHMSEKGLTPELEELFFTDKTAFFEAVEAEKERFIEEQLAPKYEGINALSEKIAEKKSQGAVAEAKQSFLKANPKADFGAMSEFYQNELTKKQQQEIDALPLEEQFKRVFELMGGGKESELPKHYEGGEVDNHGASEYGADLPAFRN